VIDLKSLVVGVVVTAVAVSGGAIYSKYLKEGFNVGTDQVGAYALLGKCVSLQRSYDIEGIKKFLSEVQSVMPDIIKSDVAVTMVAATAGESAQLPTGMGTPLRMCVNELSKKIEPE
jgi:hypothetical protein